MNNILSENKNTHIFSWSNLKKNQKDILLELNKNSTFIFKDLNNNTFKFLCTKKENDKSFFEIYTIPENWLIGEFELKKNNNINK